LQKEYIVNFVEYIEPFLVIIIFSRNLAEIFVVVV